MRWPSATFATAVLLWGFVQAPFYHIHAEDLDHEHGGGIAHIHSHGIHDAHEDAGPEIEPLTADDDAIDVVWGIAAPPGIHFDLPAEPVQRLEIAAVLSPVALIAPVQLHSHDPPIVSTEHPRPPPA